MSCSLAMWMKYRSVQDDAGVGWLEHYCSCLPFLASRQPRKMGQKEEKLG